MESVTYYEILNVVPSCSKNDIDFAYNKLMEISNQFYKDFCELDYRARIVMRIQKAHHTLSNADLRKNMTNFSQRLCQILSVSTE